MNDNIDLDRYFNIDFEEKETTEDKKDDTIITDNKEDEIEYTDVRYIAVDRYL